MIVIAFSGYAKSGKDTACRIVQRHFPAARRYAFADALKKGVAYALCTTVDNIEAHKDTYREMLQAWGGIFRATKGKDYWPQKVVRKILGESPYLAVITDLRFPEEAETLKETFSNVYVVRIERDGIKPALNHISDTALDDYPFTRVIQNNGTLADLDSEIKKLLQDLRLA